MAAAGGTRDCTEIMGYINPSPGEGAGILVSKRATPEEYKKSRRAMIENKTVQFVDARTALPGGLGAWELDKHGIMSVPPEDLPPPVDFFDEKKVKEEYFPKLVEVAKKHTGCKEVFLINYLTRVGGFTGGGGGYSRFAHTDAGPTSPPIWRKGLVEQFKLSEEYVNNCDILMANFWHPMDHPAFRDPLCLLDFSSLNWKEEVIRYRYIVSAANMVKDTRTAEEIAADASNRFKEAEAVRKKTENEGEAPVTKSVAFKSPAGIGPVYAPTHRWVYCSDMNLDEMWVWKNWDTREGVAKCCFHNSFHDPFHDNDGSPGRRNVEHRLVLTFPKKDAASGSTDADWVPVSKL